MEQEPPRSVREGLPDEKGFMMNRRTVAFLVVLSVIFRFSAYPNCGSASCPLNNHRYLGAGFFRLSLSHEYINQDLLYLGSSRSFAGAVRYDHDEIQTINQRSVAQVQVGITDRLAFNAEVPLIARQHRHILHETSGDRIESWNFVGLGDIVASAQYALLLPHTEFGPYVSLVGGIKVATGRTDLKNAEGDEAEVTIQPGTGSTDGIAGLFYRQEVATVPTLGGEFSSLPLIAGVSYQFNGAGTHGWRAGNSLLAHIGTEYQFSPSASFTMQVNARIQQYAEVGRTGEPRENTGGTWIFASPGVNVSLTGSVFAFAILQVPVYQQVHGFQQSAKMNVQVGISAELGPFN
jgi:hypothetical protein